MDVRSGLGGDREGQARDPEGEQREDDERAERFQAPDSRQGDEADQAQREGGDHQHIHEVVDDAGEMLARDSDRALGQVRGQRRLILVRVHVPTGGIEGVADCLAGQGRPEDQPVPDRPGREHEHGNGGGNQRRAEAGSGLTERCETVRSSVPSGGRARRS